MGRLIDADLLKQNCKCTGKFEDHFKCVDFIELAKVIDNQPTAFDVEKVVEELEKVSHEQFNHVQLVYLDRAVEIIRKGGIDE